MLKELNSIAIGMLGLKGFPMVPFSAPGKDRKTPGSPAAADSRSDAGDRAPGRGAPAACVPVVAA